MREHGHDAGRARELVVELGDIGRIEAGAAGHVEPTRRRERCVQAGRLFAEGGFPTNDRRARIVPTAWRPVAAAPDAAFPLLLNTGRVRDQWHTMTRTGLVPRLMQHVAGPLAAFHPTDAARLGVADRGLVRLETPDGAAVLRATIDAGQRPGEAFVPMHWSDGFASAGPVARLVGAACDTISGQPELKATKLRVTALPTAWRGLLLHAAPVLPQGVTWSRVPLATGHAFDLSGANALPEAVGGFAGTLLSCPEADVLDLTDAARGVWRFAALRDGRLHACLYLARGAKALPTPAALTALLAGPVANADRGTVLAGGAGGAATDTPVCACFAVGLQSIQAAIVDRRLTTVAEIGAALGAGTKRDSCVPELRQILRTQLADA